VEWPAKTLWDWLQLLGIPVVLATLAFLLNDAQSSRELQREDQRAARQLRTAADAERENTLRTYLAQMSDLMLDRGLLRSNPGAEVRKVARTATLTAVRRLDGARRGLVVQFLAEARLLRRETGHTAAVNVASADLLNAYVRGANLSSADLRRANLRGADLRDALLSGADFRRAFSGVDPRTNLKDVDLSGASGGAVNLHGAVLFGTKLGGVMLPGSDLRANFRGVDLRAAMLEGSNLRGAILASANLSGADLRSVDLRGADLDGANLRGADLTGADLRGARDADLANSKGTPAHGP
jgi:uncharacterized protein YjbI with pentapeptide repeats